MNWSRKVITNFVTWGELNHLRINASKTREVVIDFSRKAPHIAPVNIQGLDMRSWRSTNTWVFTSTINWNHNTNVLYKKGQSHLHLLRRLSDVLRCGLLELWKLREGQEETQQTGQKGWFTPDCSLDSIEEVIHPNCCQIAQQS
ncbi:hypothetical protein D4764_13G0000450 [Takifugu flavidus]|uniref:Uncharacterized protein n=1 Tax=Takifugu flavidus TaxID=433684 RepID=A0A5C6P7E0_9TELE|nr:hypothetical protein D4764_13G0000450 [Takifugu flavidus]